MVETKEKGWNENKEKSKPVKESMENMNENEDVKKLKSINKKKSMLTKLPVMESIYEPMKENPIKVETPSKPVVKEGFDINSNECTNTMIMILQTKS